MTEPVDVRDWWSAQPMTYGGTHGETNYAEGSVQRGSREFFEQADRRFYSWNTPLHDHRPFGRLFPYDDYRGKKVLEVGCGMGAMAMNWARAGAQMTAVDLTPTAVEQTRRRLELFGLQAEVRQADGRKLPFEDGQFDYVYSWGVLHHSPDLDRSIAELMRVVKPGGGFGVMLYHRHSFLYGYMVRFLEGIPALREPLSRSARRWQAAMATARARRAILIPGRSPNPKPAICSESSAGIPTIDVLGTDLDSIFPYVIPGLGEFLPAWFKKPWARRFGWSLWMHGHRA